MTKRRDIEAEIESLELIIKSYQSRLDKVKESLASLPPEKFELWEPEGEEEWYTPSTANFGFAAVYASPNYWPAVRGLAFKSIHHAVEVGHYLQVVGKISNMAKQMNEGKVFGELSYYIRSSGPRLVIVGALVHKTGPRFHSSEAAERALELLTDEEKTTLIKGIS